ncbi:MAG: zinc ribbon domain-containing protein [Bacteroidaceae bacterium]|nr:zinc ribbon domain-containing protein [Bacteroidaceae bacterium]
MSMIKCPECGERVSTMAGTCPHCGINIAGNLKQCPNCNEYCLNTQEKCPYCGATLSVETEEKIEPQPEQTTQEAAESKEKPAAKNRKSLIFSITFATVVLITICGLYYMDYRNDIAREEREYAMLENTSNPEYYNDFLAKYPKSEHYQEVKERLNVLLDETEEWNKMMQNVSRSEIEKFMSAHPYSRRLHECEDMIDSIDWNDAKKLNTEEAIVNYLNTHPNGKYAEEASAKKNELGLMKITAQDKAIIRGALENFFTVAMSKQDVALIADAIPEKMENFCGTQDATPDQIVAFAKNKMASDVMGLHYTIDNDFDVRKQTITDGTTGYAVTFTLQELISRSDTNQPGNKSYQVTALLNAEHKIIRMSIR